MFVYEMKMMAPKYFHITVIPVIGAKIRKILHKTGFKTNFLSTGNVKGALCHNQLKLLANSYSGGYYLSLNLETIY